MVFPVSALFPIALAFLSTTVRSIAETMLAEKEHFSGESHAFWKKPCKRGAGNRYKGVFSPVFLPQVSALPLNLQRMLYC